MPRLPGIYARALSKRLDDSSAKSTERVSIYVVVM